MFGVSEATIIKYLLIFARCMGFIALVPVFGGVVRVVKVQVGFALVLAGAFAPLAPVPVQTPYTLPMLAYLAFKEFAFGALMGGFVWLLFSAVRFAGDIAAMQMGFRVATFFDPTMGEEVSILSQFTYIFAGLIFLSLDGHLMLIKALAESFSLIRAGEIVFAKPLLASLAMRGSEVFALALKLASPVIAALILTYFALGLLSRAVPQMNVFMIGFPITISIGLLVFALSIPVFADIFKGAFAQWIEDMGLILKALVGEG